METPPMTRARRRPKRRTNPRLTRRTRALLLVVAVGALLTAAPRRAAALDDTVRDVLIGTGAGLTLGAVVGLIIYLVQEPYEPPKPSTPAAKPTAFKVPPAFATIGLAPLPVGAAVGSRSTVARPTALLRF